MHLLITHVYHRKAEVGSDVELPEVPSKFWGLTDPVDLAEAAWAIADPKIRSTRYDHTQDYTREYSGPATKKLQ